MHMQEDNKQPGIGTDCITSLEQETSTGMFIYIIFDPIFRNSELIMTLN